MNVMQNRQHFIFYTEQDTVENSLRGDLERSKRQEHVKNAELYKISLTWTWIKSGWKEGNRTASSYFLQLRTLLCLTEPIHNHTNRRILWVRKWTLQNGETPCWETWIGWKSGPTKTLRGSTKTNARSCTWENMVQECSIGWDLPDWDAAL